MDFHAGDWLGLWGCGSTAVGLVEIGVRNPSRLITAFASCLHCWREGYVNSPSRFIASRTQKTALSNNQAGIYNAPKPSINSAPQADPRRPLQKPKYLSLIRGANRR